MTDLTTPPDNLQATAEEPSSDLKCLTCGVDLPYVPAPPRKILARDLTQMLVFGGFIAAGWDDRHAMDKIAYLADLLNASLDAVPPSNDQDSKRS